MLMNWRRPSELKQDGIRQISRRFAIFRGRLRILELYRSIGAGKKKFRLCSEAIIQHSYIGNAWNNTVVGGMNYKDAFSDAIEEIEKEMRAKQEEYGVRG